MAEKKSLPWYWLSVPVIFVIAIVVFLSTKDCYQQYCITGWEVLKIQWPSFWVFAIGGIILAIICAVIAFNNELKGGSSGKTFLFVVLTLIFMCGPWGKACTDKANGGVTAPGFKSEQAVP